MISEVKFLFQKIMETEPFEKPLQGRRFFPLGPQGRGRRLRRQPHQMKFVAIEHFPRHFLT